MTTTIVILAAFAFFVLFLTLFIIMRENGRLREQVDKLNEVELVANAFNDNCFYDTAETPYGYAILKKHQLYPNTTIIVQEIFDDDIDYARRCAEERCDMLNEPI